MKDSLVETLVGAAVAAVAIGFFVFAFDRGGEPGGQRGGYELWGAFQRVDGIAAGSDVRMSGVKVGVVRSVELDPQTFNAILRLSIDPGVEVLDDTSATVRSDALLGGAHVALEPAGFEPLAPGDQILRTQGATDLVTLLLSAMSSMGASGEEEAGASPAQP